MKKEVYYCDNCNKELGNNMHLSIIFKSYSGWVGNKSLIEKMPNWKHLSQVKGIMQFCDEKCLAQYFKKQKPLKK